jgi:cell filamentation protein
VFHRAAVHFSPEADSLEMSTLRAEEPLPSGRFTPAHYKRIHHHLFQDVYPWAGKYRKVRTAKGGNMFCYPEHIASSINQLFKKLALGAFKPDASAADFLDAATDFLAELNAIHPFREGNGRSQPRSLTRGLSTISCLLVVPH